jgi:hypothetical protein
VQRYIPFFFCTITLFAIKIEFIGITSQVIPFETHNKASYYKITAKKYIEKFEKKDRVIFFINRKSYMLRNNYYSDGLFKSKKTELSYKKCYILFGKIYLFDVNGTIDNAKVIAKEIVFDGYRNYLLKKCEVKKNGYTYRRNRFKLPNLLLQ